MKIQKIQEGEIQKKSPLCCILAVTFEKTIVRYHLEAQREREECYCIFAELDKNYKMFVHLSSKIEKTVIFREHNLKYLNFELRFEFSAENNFGNDPQLPNNNPNPTICRYVLLIIILNINLPLLDLWGNH